MTPTGTITTLVDFNDANGANSDAGLELGSGGNLYGTTSSGGSLGYGTVFQITTSGALTTLVDFNYTNGSSPQSQLVLGSDGNFYGTTYGGGSLGSGTVFRMTTSGILTTLVNFDRSNGANPRTGLVQGSDGNFYGTTMTNGSGGTNGTVFRMAPSGALTTLTYLPSPNALVQGSDGNFYGTTYKGGSSADGMVFRMLTSGTVMLDWCRVVMATSTALRSAAEMRIVKAAAGPYFR
jgi:uncharacterized repeat protein (TIGR03803 family)